MKRFLLQIPCPVVAVMLLLAPYLRASLSDQVGAANAALEAGHPIEALDTYKALLAAPEFAKRGSSELWYNRGLAEEKNGDAAAASLSFRRALLLDPGFAPAQRQLTAMLGLLGLPAPTGWRERVHAAVHPETLILVGAEVRITEFPDPKKRRITASGGPNELVRRLWNYRADYDGEAGVNGEVPSWFHMDEKISKGMIVSDASFMPGAFLACHRFTTEIKPWQSANLPGIRDLFAAMLFVRSQSLHDGDHLRMTIFPDRNPYLVDLTVEGRDTVMLMRKKIPSIRFTVRIQTIETEGDHKGRLAPHRKFRSGRVWMSDDARRLPLRAEVDVFIGAVFAELVKITPSL